MTRAYPEGMWINVLVCVCGRRESFVGGFVVVRLGAEIMAVEADAHAEIIQRYV